MAVAESRALELRFTPMDVTEFEKALTRLDLRQLPPDLLTRTWLLDLELVATDGGPPRLVDHALARLLSLHPGDPELTTAEANLVRLLQMTPANADLSGTALEPLLELAPRLGFAVPEVLGATLGVGPGDAFLPTSTVAEALAAGIIGSHDNARHRPGPRTPERPDGVWPVTPGTLPVMLEDVLSDLRTLVPRFGPYVAEGRYHPGFLGRDLSAELFGDDFAIVVEANVNAVPDKGIDLESASLAGVNSIDDHPEVLFDFTDPDWMRVEGTAADPPTIGRMTFVLVEDPRRLAPGSGPEPAPRGNGEVWTAPRWTLERVVAEAAFASWGRFSMDRQWRRGAAEAPLLSVRVEDGWMEVMTAGRVGDPPPPAYLWDLVLDAAQQRLHDGGLAEGAAQVGLTLTDVPLGLSLDALVDRIREALREDAAPLVAVAVELFDNTWGEADLFYRRPRGLDEDWLFFVHETDIPADRGGEPVRPWSYRRPGFWEDVELTEALHTTEVVDGDGHHLKVRVLPGDTLYCEDEGERVFRIDVGGKPSRARLPLTVTRVR